MLHLNKNHLSNLLSMISYCRTYGDVTKAHLARNMPCPSGITNGPDAIDRAVNIGVIYVEYENEGVRYYDIPDWLADTTIPELVDGYFAQFMKWYEETQEAASWNPRSVQEIWEHSVTPDERFYIPMHSFVVSFIRKHSYLFTVTTKRNPGEIVDVNSADAPAWDYWLVKPSAAGSNLYAINELLKTGEYTPGFNEPEPEPEPEPQPEESEPAMTTKDQKHEDLNFSVDYYDSGSVLIEFTGAPDLLPTLLKAARAPVNIDQDNIPDTSFECTNHGDGTVYVKFDGLFEKALPLFEAYRTIV